MPKKLTKKQFERREAWMRIPVFIISGIILAVWRYLIYVFAIINFINTIFTGRRIKDISDMSEIWNTQLYIFFRYITFVCNVRPFPFEKLTKNFSEFK